jgi:hypothetical protein
LTFHAEGRNAYAGIATQQRSSTLKALHQENRRDAEAQVRDGKPSAARVRQNRRNPRSEGANSERNPKTEAQRPSDFGLRISFGFRLVGLRIYFKTKESFNSQNPGLPSHASPEIIPPLPYEENVLGPALAGHNAAGRGRLRDTCAETR